jgi:hypothetical protein
VKSSLPVSEVLNLHGDCIAANMFKTKYGPQSSFSFLWLGSSGKNFIKLRFGKVVSCTSLTEVSKWLSLYDNCYTAASGQSPLGWQELLKANVLSQHGSDPQKLLEYLKS